jgi:hypothetical protein
MSQWVIGVMAEGTRTEVRAVKKNLAEKLERLSLSDIVGREDKGGERGEELQQA